MEKSNSRENLFKIKSILFMLFILVVLACAYFIFDRIKSYDPPEPIMYVWDVEDTDLTHIKISLPREGKEQSFIKIPEGDRFPWFFDDPQKSNVDTERWGGGIPLLLSGPSADRIILENATDEQLEKFGLTKPSMEISLTLKDGDTITILVGDSTPNGQNFYIMTSDIDSVATVDFSWYYVLHKLITDPPYASGSDPDSDETVSAEA